MVSPCCCSLQAGTKAVAILQIIGSIVWIILSVLTMLGAKQHFDQQGKSMPAAVIAIGVIIILMFVLGLILGIVLLMGANARDLRKCRIWFNVTLVITIISIISIVFSAFSAGGANIQGVIQVLFSIYFLWVVYAFMEEIKSGGPTTQSV